MGEPQATPQQSAIASLHASRLNTLVIIASFAGSIFLGGIAYSKLQNGIDDATGFEVETKERLARLDSDRANSRTEFSKQMIALTDLIAKQQAVADQMQYQIGGLQKFDEAINNRVDRMSDTYGERFNQINENFNELKTNVALTNQILNEIKDQVIRQRRDDAKFDAPRSGRIPQ